MVFLEHRSHSWYYLGKRHGLVAHDWSLNKEISYRGESQSASLTFATNYGNRAKIVNHLPTYNWLCNEE